MRKRLQFSDSVVAYENKLDLNDRIYTPTLTNEIDGKVLGLPRKVKAKIETLDEWVLFVSKCLSLDIMTYRLYLYVALECYNPNSQRLYIVPDDARDWLNNNYDDKVAKASIYNSIKALCWIRAIWPIEHEKQYYHVNHLFFTPGKAFRTNLVFLP